jgi:hypothetical protein
MAKPGDDAAIRTLLALMDEAFDRRAWHGTNLRGSLRGLTARQAAWRPRPGRHNVWEVALHAAYWKHAVWRRLVREQRGSFPLRGSNWFRRPEGSLSEKAWRADVALLVEQHRRLREIAARLRAADLGRVPPGGRVPIGTLLRGIASHDLYHAGQIQLLKRLRPSR